jgi:hypothetical protein
MPPRMSVLFLHLELRLASDVRFFNGNTNAVHDNNKRDAALGK